ncbi:hypothetical protein, partial [Acetobacter syzygii]
ACPTNHSIINIFHFLREPSAPILSDFVIFNGKTAFYSPLTPQLVAAAAFRMLCAAIENSQ